MTEGEAKLNLTLGDESGTANSIIQLANCTLVGVEARCTEPISIDGKHVHIFESDDEPKCKKITRKVCITASGSRSRNKALWDHLTETVNNDSDGDVNWVLDKIGEFLRANQLVKRSSAIELFVVGYCNDMKKCVSFIAGDNHKPQLVKSNFEAIGGGASSVRRVLSICNIRGDTPVKLATEYTMNALIHATFSDPKCGGFLRVWKIEANMCEELEALHAVDALIDHYPFLPVELLVFDRNTYAELNYYSLYCCLESLCLSSLDPVVPGCFGIVKEAWKLHLVRLNNANEVEVFFRKTEKIPNLSGARRMSFNGVKMYAVRGTKDNLIAAKRGVYLFPKFV